MTESEMDELRSIAINNLTKIIHKTILTLTNYKSSNNNINNAYTKCSVDTSNNAVM